MPVWTPLPLEYDKYAKGTETFVASTTVIDANSLGKSTAAGDTERQEHFVRLLKSIAWHLGSDNVPVFLSFNGDERRMDKGCIGHAVAAGVLDAPKNGPEGYMVSVTLSAQTGGTGKNGKIELGKFKQDYRAYVLSKYMQFELTVQSGKDKEYYFREVGFPPQMRLKHSFTTSSVVLVCEGRWKDLASAALANKIPDTMRIELHPGTLHLIARTEPIDFTEPVEKQSHLIDAAMNAAQQLLPYATRVQQAAPR
jgi:hypothetical protein